MSGSFLCARPPGQSTHSGRSLQVLGPKRSPAGRASEYLLQGLGGSDKGDWKKWKPEQLKPYIDHGLETFGFKRIMFGSDWPVCTLACSFRRWMEVLGEITRGCTPDERERLFSGNARKFYGIRA